MFFSVIVMDSTLFSLKMSMKIAVLLVLAAAAVAVSAESPFHRLPKTSKKVGSPYPFAVCSGAPTDFAVSALDVSPDPPVKGQNINMVATATVGM